ncbi:hypothetical protein [Streptomyces sp. NBC_00057]|uniref:hypothetical protein n=1 Tax=Streptomyces sp. NBC_00057 TaxID=2975634 RepID=UPI00324EDC35
MRGSEEEGPVQLLLVLVAEHLVHQKFAQRLLYAVAVPLLVVVQIEVGVRLHRGDRGVLVLDDQPGADGARLESLVVSEASRTPSMPRTPPGRY